MKIVNIVFLIAAFSLFTSGIIAQDIIVTTAGKTMHCNITKIADDTLFFKVKLNDRMSNTFIVTSQLKEYSIGKVEELRASLDTSSFFTIKLEDGTGLTGKVRSIFESKVLFEDNNFGVITIKGETIESFAKEDKNTFYFITLIDGNEIHGKIIERKKYELDIQTETLGKVTIPLKNIKKMTEVQQGRVKDGEYWFPNPNSTRYLFSPTAIPLKKGEGYYQNAYVLANSANYGISDNFTIGGGVFLPVAAFITPKIGFKVAEKVHVGAGAILGLFPGPTTVGILFGVATYGSTEHNFTLGAGYGFVADEFIQYPMITLSGMTRVSRRIALVTENWIVPLPREEYVNGNYVETTEYYTVVSYGLRIMKERITFDIALINSKDIIQMIPIGIPYIDFVYKF